ncbi:trypco2 family protein [Streptomyces mirabilis]|uniref:trypco2 family protein n=1 Tax=Streptomyces mirabilis TaxID=68239 RepID=UPI0036E7CB24
MEWSIVALLASSELRAAGDLRGAMTCAQEAVHACRRAVAARDDNSEVQLVQALLALAGDLAALGSSDEALDIVEEALFIAREQTAKAPDGAAGPRLILARALDTQAGLVADRGDFEDALNLANEAVAAYLATTANEDSGPTQMLLLAQCLNNRALIAAAAGDYGTATADLERAVGLYREAITSGARHGEALLSRALQAQNAIQEERGAGPMHDAVQASYAYLAAARHDPQVLATDLGPASTSLFLTGFGPREEAGSRPGPAPEDLTKEGTGALRQEGNTYVELAEAIEGVRDALLHTAAASATGVRFEVGPIELEFGVELRADPKTRTGIRVMVLTGGPDKAAGAAQHRIRLQLTPQSDSGRSLMIGDGPDNYA